MLLVVNSTTPFFAEKPTMATLNRSVLVFSLALVTVAHVRADDKPAPVPEGAIVLFDGKSLDNWSNLKGKAAGWKVDNGYMECVPKSGNIVTKGEFGPDYQLHVEFWLPLMKDAKGQGRANSGVYLCGRYEIQVLDSYMNETYPDGACGALYKIIAPSKNASKPPEQWQTYDITLHAPRVGKDGKVTKKGRVTVVHNGETVIDNGEFDRNTQGGVDNKLASIGPILLQDHGNKIRFRNIWLKPLQ